MPFEAIQAVFRSLSIQKESKLSKMLFTCRALHKLSFLRPNYSFQSSGMYRKQISRVFGFKRFPAPSSFTFRFFSSPLLLLFPHFLCWAFTTLSFGGKRFCKKPEDCEISWKEGRVGSGARFPVEFSGQSYMVFVVFSGLFD